MPDPPPFTFVELIAARAADPATANRTMCTMDARATTYAEYARISAAWAHLFLRSAPAGRAARVAVLMRNCPEFLFAYGGTAMAGATLFGVNTGLAGDTLARVIEAADADVIVVDEANRAALSAISARLAAARERVVLEAGDGGSLDRALARLRADMGAAIDERPDVASLDGATPWIVIYTSGTTGLPKGIVNSQAKLRVVGAFGASVVGLRPDDVGYVSMPLFHSNAVYLNWLPAFTVGASVVLRDKFSASEWLPDVLRHGATFWNYVGQPVHYVLEAIARAHGGDEARILREVRDDPRRKIRFCLGTGASGRERERLTRWLGLEHVYEIYGSTEAEISTWCMPGDPIDSVGEVRDDAVAIVNERGEECAPLEVDERGSLVNQAAATGEIVRRGAPAGLFQGYFAQPEATAKKVEGGAYHSGDLGMVRKMGGKRYLYFAGRTDDWIRKDGENFASDSVVEMVEAFPAVDRAAAYGVPHPVSDEWVMVALRLRAGHAFDPQALFDHCEREVSAGGRDRKWFPDVVRVVDDFTWTETHKIVVRHLKAEFYRPGATARVYLRRRGDTTFRPLDAAAFDALRREFAEAGREHLLGRA